MTTARPHPDQPERRKVEAAHAGTVALQGGVLKSILVDWLAGTAEIRIAHEPSPGRTEELVLRFNGLARLIFPREGQWRGEIGLARIHGPMLLEHDRQHLRIEMGSGDVIELDYVSQEVETPFARHRASPKVKDPNPHPEIPDLHDAPLRDVRLSWADGTAEILVGPLLSTSSAIFGAEYVALRFQGLRRFICPRRLPWDYFNPDILAVLGPAKVEGDAWHLRLAMQDGDVIEIDYLSLVAAPVTSLQPSGA